MTAATGPGPKERGKPRETETATDAGPGRTSRAAPPLGAIIASLLVGLLLGAAGATFLANQDSSPFAGVIDSGRYQAVILSNDKVYFGKLDRVSDDYYRLDQAFFLRETRENADAEPVRALLPVNREIHAPDNTMLIRDDEVVLVENLAKDSPILSEIRRQLGGK